MFHKSIPVLIFLRFTFIQITSRSFHFLFLVSSNIQHNIHSHAYIVPTTRGHHIIIFHTTLFDLTFRDYCGIKLLLGHQYGSHYQYLNLKNIKSIINYNNLWAPKGCFPVTCFSYIYVRNARKVEIYLNGLYAITE